MTNEEAIRRLKHLTEYEYDEELEALEMAISALNQYDGMTNGEVIKALFPKIHPCNHEQYISIYSQGSDDFFNHCQFDPKWWNAPYKAESEDI